MDDRINRLKTPEDCIKFANNASRLGRSDLALEAKKKEIELKAEAYGATSTAQVEAIAAVFAYEEVLTKRNGKPTKASRTWPMIERHGIIEAVERAVNRPTETIGYKALLEMGLQEYAFEAVILRHSELFSKATVSISKERMQSWIKP